MFSIRPLSRCCISVKHYIDFSNVRIPSRSAFGKRNNVPKLQPPFTPSTSGAPSIGYHTLTKPLIFTVCFTSGAFICSAIWQYEEMRKKASNFRNRFGFYSRTNRKPINNQLMFWWHRLTEGQKVASVIIATNALVFCMWRLPVLQPFMCKFFTACPSAEAKCLPLILSTFSHYSFLHMATNMYVLYSFSSGAVAFLGKEQFLAFYLSSGVISSFASFFHKIATRRFAPSLGASGSLLAILSLTCLQFPHMQLSIVFLPFITLSAGHAIKGVMALDLIGILAKWRYFDHAAHFGGALFGIFYLKCGHEYIWGKRERIIVYWWHNMRQKFN